METFGEAVRRLRGSRSMRSIARDAHVDPGYLSRIEHEKQTPSAEVAIALDEALGADGRLAALIDTEPEPWHLDGGLWRLADSDRLAAELIAEPPQMYEMRAGRRIGEAAVRQVEDRVHQLRLVDDHVGGEDTHAMVTGELSATGALLRHGAYTEEIGKRLLLVAVGELCQLAGWTLSGAGQYARTEQVYLLGVRAAHAGGDPAVAANNLSSLAYQVANIGDPRGAETLARSAYVGAKREVSATTRALLAERVAWAAARMGEARDAEGALSTVEHAYDRRSPGDEPIWTYWLDEGEIEIMAGRVWTQLRRPLRAVPILEEATKRYGEDTGRETALYLTWLAESLLQANEVERAA
jgi:transcriptional regulator with XRE-family HTH domain